MTVLSASVDLDLPPEQAWALLTDWQRQGEWIPLTDVTVTGGPPAGLGTKLSGRTGIGPLGFTDRMEIDVWDWPRRFEVAHLGALVTGRGVFIIDERPGGGSRVTWQERLESTGVRRVIDPLGALPGRAMLAVALRRLGRLAAQPPTRPAA